MSEIPDVQTIPEWEWVKIATGVTTGFLNRLDSTVYYYQTYRPTTGTAPTAPTVGTIPEEAVKIFEQSNQEIISATTEIDVYIMCANNDDDDADNGKVRVDL